MPCSRPSKTEKKCPSNSGTEAKWRKDEEESTSTSMRKQPAIFGEEKVGEGADKSITSYDDTLAKGNIALDSPQGRPLDPALPQGDAESAGTND